MNGIQNKLPTEASKSAPSYNGYPTTLCLIQHEPQKLSLLAAAILLRQGMMGKLENDIWGNWVLPEMDAGGLLLCNSATA